MQHPIAIQSGNVEDEEYAAYLGRVQRRFQHQSAGHPLFVTDAAGLWEIYLDSLPAEQHQFHTCHACRTFIERFGCLAVVDERGSASSPIWDAEDAPELYREAVTQMAALVRRSRIVGVFLCAAPEWGTPTTGPWRHFALLPSAQQRYQRTTQTAGQKMAERREDYHQVMRALEDYPQALTAQAVRILQSDALYRSEHVLEQGEWLHGLHVAREGLAGRCRQHIVWRAMATAPAGFCHPRASMIGTLLEDLRANLGFEETARRFADKMHPLRYQRPQAAPKAGQIAQAETVVAELRAAGALDRRFARLEEIEALWRPQEPKGSKAPARTGAVFAHLKPKGSQPPAMDMPARTMTWAKFRAEVLPKAQRMELRCPKRGNYVALLTAANPDAPPILQWDRPERRNPFSWYVYHTGSPREQWRLKPGWTPVSAVTLKPSMWGDETANAHHGKGVVFVLAGAQDTRGSGTGLFPEILRAEFHGVRHVIEEYSRTAQLGGRDEASACGLILQSSAGTWDARIRVVDGMGRAEYTLDRWD